jgi:hypothetical protein
VVGSVADLAFRSVHCPVIIVKDALPEGSAPRTYVVAADETERAFNAYAMTLVLARFEPFAPVPSSRQGRLTCHCMVGRPKDKVIVLHMYIDSCTWSSQLMGAALPDLTDLPCHDRAGVIHDGVDEQLTSPHAINQKLKEK